MSLIRSREQVAALVNSWVGLKESDGSHKKIIDIYNSYSPIPDGVKMQYNWAWCAATWSAIAIELGYTDIMPIGISCSRLIAKAINMGIWVEDDRYVPKIGDACLYHWADNKQKYSVSDCVGAPDHIGTVTYVNESSGYFVVTEGNYSDSVKKRTVDINGCFIRGFICPKYDDYISKDDDSGLYDLDLTAVAREVIVGKWGNGIKRKERLEKAGYVYKDVQTEVNRILNGKADKPQLTNTSQIQPTSKKVAATTYPEFSGELPREKHLRVTTALYLRNGAGTNKKALCLMPKGTIVSWGGSYSKVGNQNWYYVATDLNGVEYIGFCSAAYLSTVL